MVKISGLVGAVNRSNDLSTANARLAQLRQQHQLDSTAHVHTRTPLRHNLASDCAVSGVETTCSWLAPLQARLQPAEEIAPHSTSQNCSDQPRHNSADKPLNQTQTILAHPSILIRLLDKKLAAVGRVWLLARLLDEAGQGWIAVDTLRARLTKKGAAWHICGWRRLRQLLAQGASILWERDKFGRIWLYGHQTVANKLSIDRLGKKCIRLPITPLLESLAHTKAAYYASIHAIRQPRPISRATLQNLTGVSERTQRTYDQLANVRRKTNIGITLSANAVAQETLAYTRGRATFIYTDRKGIFGRKGQTYHAHQLPNSYTAPYQTTKRKHSKKRKDAQQTDLAVKEVQGNSLPIARRFFLDLKALRKNDEGGYLLKNALRHHTIWCLQ